MKKDDTETLIDGMGNEIPRVTLSAEEEEARQRRSRRLGWALAGFAVLVCVVTALRLSANFNSGG